MEKTNVQILEKYNSKTWTISAVLGVFIGLAIIVPGVSGATIAIIFGLYTKLIYSIGNIFNDFKRCFLFLLPIVIGAVLGFLIGLLAVQKLFDIMPFTIVCLFTGLMVGAFPAILDEVKGVKFSKLRIFLLILGVLIPILIGVLSIIFTGSTDSVINLSWKTAVVYIFLGIIVSLTQIIPGLSATALLMAFGQFGAILSSIHYDFIMENPFVLVLYLALGIGFVIGLVLFSKALNKLLEKKKDTIFCLIVGLSAGSIIEMFVNPDIYEVYVGWGTASSSAMILDIVIGVILFIIGVILSYLLVRYERKHKEKSKESLIETNENSNIVEEKNDEESN